MVLTNWFVPFKHAGREIRIELHSILQNIRFESLMRRLRSSAVLVLPEQRVEDREIARQRGAELLLNSVRLGAIRR